jgi:hypothetical protein
LDPLVPNQVRYQTALHSELVAGPGIEPGTRAYETRVLPLHYPAITLLKHTPNKCLTLVVPCARHILLRTPPGLGNIDEKYILIKCLATPTTGALD